MIIKGREVDFETLKTKEFKLKGFVLRVIPATIENAKQIYKIFSSDAQNMIFWAPNGLFKSTEHALVNYYQRNRSARLLMFGIFKDGKLLGEIGFSDVSVQSGCVAIGYWLKKSARGQGIINKLMPKIEKMAFDQEWCHKIRLCCDAENIASRKIAESNKYKLEGLFRQEAKWPDGTLRDKLYFGKLKSDIVKS